MFNKKKEPEKKVNKYQIENSFEQSKESIQEMLDKYDENIDTYTQKIVSLIKENRITEANRYKAKLKQLLYRKERMGQLYDKIDSFEMMINEAFAKQEVYKTLGKTMAQVNSVTMDAKVDDFVKEIKNFEKSFDDKFSKFDQLLDGVGRSLNSIDLDESNEYDAEIQAIVNGKLDEMEKTTFNVNQDSSEIDNLINSL